MGNDSSIDVVTVKPALVLFPEIVGDRDMAALAFVVFLRCGGLWEVNRIFDVAEKGPAARAW
jgi:hypothetical protein